MIIEKIAAMTSEMAVPTAMSVYYVGFSNIVWSSIAGLGSFGLTALLGWGGLGEKIFTAFIVMSFVMILIMLLRKPPRRKVISRIFNRRWVRGWTVWFRMFKRRPRYNVINRRRAKLVAQQAFGMTVRNDVDETLKQNTVLRMVYHGIDNNLSFINRDNVEYYYRKFCYEYVNNRAWLISTDDELISQPVISRHELAQFNGQHQWLQGPNQLVQFWNGMMMRMILCNNLLHRISTTEIEIVNLLTLIRQYMLKRIVTPQDMLILQRLVMFDIIVHRSKRHVFVTDQNDVAIPMETDGQNQQVNFNPARDEIPDTKIQRYATRIKGRKLAVEWSNSYNYQVLAAGAHAIQRANGYVNVDIQYSTHTMTDLEHFNTVDFVVAERGPGLRYFIIVHDNNVLQMYGGRGKYESGVKRIESTTLNIWSELDQGKLKALNKSGVELNFNNSDHNEHAFAHALSKMKMIELLNANVGRNLFEISSSMTGVQFTNGLNFSVANLCAHDATRLNNVLTRCDQLYQKKNANNFISLTIGDIDKLDCSRMLVDKVVTLNTQFDMTSSAVANFLASSGLRHMESMMNFDTRVLTAPYVYNCQNSEDWRLVKRRWFPTVHGDYWSCYQVESWFHGKTQIYTHDLSNIMDWLGTTEWVYNNRKMVNEIVDYNGDYIHMTITLDDELENKTTVASRISTNKDTEDTLLRIKGDMLGIEFYYSLTYQFTKDYMTSKTWAHGGGLQRDNIIEENQPRNVGLATRDLRHQSENKNPITHIYCQDGEWFEENIDSEGRAEFGNELFRVMRFGDFARFSTSREHDLNVNARAIGYVPILDQIERSALDGRYTMDEMGEYYGVNWNQGNKYQHVDEILDRMSVDYNLIFDVCGHYYTVNSYRYNKRMQYLIVKIGIDYEVIEVHQMSEFSGSVVNFDSDELRPLFFCGIVSLSDSDCVNVMMNALGIRNDEIQQQCHTFQTLFMIVGNQQEKRGMNEIQLALMEKTSTNSTITKDIVNHFLTNEPGQYAREVQQWRQGLNDPVLTEHFVPDTSRDKRLARVQENTVSTVDFKPGNVMGDFMNLDYYVPMPVTHNLKVYYKDSLYTNSIDGLDNAFECLVFKNHIYLITTAGMETINQNLVIPNGQNAPQIPQGWQVCQYNQLPYIIVRGIENGEPLQFEEQMVVPEDIEILIDDLPSDDEFEECLIEKSSNEKYVKEEGNEKKIDLSEGRTERKEDEKEQEIEQEKEKDKEIKEEEKEKEKEKEKKREKESDKEDQNKERKERKENEEKKQEEREEKKKEIMKRRKETINHKCIQEENQAAEDKDFVLETKRQIKRILKRYPNYFDSLRESLEKFDFSKINRKITPSVFKYRNEFDKGFVISEVVSMMLEQGLNYYMKFDDDKSYNISKYLLKLYQSDIRYWQHAIDNNIIAHVVVNVRTQCITMEFSRNVKSQSDSINQNVAVDVVETEQHNVVNITTQTATKHVNNDTSEKTFEDGNERKEDIYDIDDNAETEVVVSGETVDKITEVFDSTASPDIDYVFGSCGFDPYDF